jgi:hypothetical protein
MTIHGLYNIYEETNYVDVAVLEDFKINFFYWCTVLPMLVVDSKERLQYAFCKYFKVNVYLILCIII